MRLALPAAAAIALTALAVVSLWRGETAPTVAASDSARSGRASAVPFKETSGAGSRTPASGELGLKAL